MVGPLVYDLAKLHVAELLEERARDRLAEHPAPEGSSRTPRIDFRRLLRPLRTMTGTTSA